MITKAHIKNIEARVRRGAKWLDKNEPGWETKINPSLLEMQSGQDCVLGQVFFDRTDPDAWDNGFDIGLKVLWDDKGEKDEIDAYYGFNEYRKEEDSLENDDSRQFWSLLAEEWIHAAKERVNGNLG